MSSVLERLVRQLGVLAVFLVAFVPTVDLVAQSFSKKIAVESPRSGGSLGSATISVQKIGRATAVKLSAPTAISANAFYLGGPARLVVDVAGCKTRRSEKFSVASHPAVSGIRVGAHTDKLRMVVDLTANTEPDFKVAVSGREVTLTITDEAQSEERVERVVPTIKPSAMPAQVQPVLPDAQPTEAQPTGAQAAETSVPTPTLAPIEVAPTVTGVEAKVADTNMPVDATVAPPTPEPSPSSSPTALPILKPTLKPLVPEVKPTVKEPIAKPVAPGPTQTTSVASPMRGAITYLLTGYRFEYLEPGRVPILKISLNKPRANAQISKVGPKAYKIVIPSCGIGGKGLDLPQFPPADFLGFVMIAAKAVDDKTEITVSVEQGVALGTFVRQNEIWVKRL
jgi:hypothetical protein